MKRTKDPIEQFMGEPTEELRIVQVGGQSIFPVNRRAKNVAVFVEYNGYRRKVIFPLEPRKGKTWATSESKSTQRADTDASEKKGTAS